ncbi:MAG: ABC transporter substrate-binding protein [Lachnospiraceae bacterium]|nr:ABC transporter substrate-binding protein [Lachnospiraceae bacterium]
MKKRILGLLLSISVLASLAIGCAPAAAGSDASAGGSSSGASDGDITLTWAVFETDNYTAEMWQKIIDAFEADNPGIKIEKVLMTGDSRPQFLKTMLAAGNMPDINVDPVDLATTDGIYAEVPEELLEKYEDAAIATYNGKHTLVPAYKALRNQCYYHKDQFKEAGITEEPKTWEEFLDVCEKLMDAGKVPLMSAGASDIWATSFGWWTGVTNSEIMAKYPNFNEQILKGELSWTDPVIADSLKAWQGLVDAGYYHKGSMSFSYTQAQSEFLDGATAMFMDGAWAAPSFDAAGITPDELGCFVVPTPSGAYSYCTMPQYWGVSETCAHKDEAFKFCEYVLGGNEDIYRLYLSSDGTYSVTKNPVLYDMGPIQTEFVSNYDDCPLVTEIMKAVGDISMPSGFEDYTCKSLQNVFTGSDVDEELKKWDEEFNKMLEAK